MSISNPKKYYWLKLKSGFFDDRNVKLLRAQECGDTLVLVYLMMQCRALKSDGVIDYRRILPSIEDEIALDIDTPVDIVRSALDLMERIGLIERVDNNALLMCARDEISGLATKAKVPNEYENIASVKKRYNVTNK